MNSRPNAPINVLVGALILKDFTNLTDKELTEACEFDFRYLFEEAHADGKKVIGIIDSGASESLVRKQSWLINESDDKNKKETGEDRNGHGTEMVQIFSNLSQDSSYLYSIKAFDKEGNGYLSSVLMALKLAKAEQADLVNISANTKVKANFAILQSVISDAAKESQIVVPAGNNADYASGNSSVSGSSGTQPREDGSSDSGTDSKTRPFSAARPAPKLNAKEADPSDSDDRVITAEFMDTPNKVIIKKVDQNGKLLDGGEFTFTDPNGNKIVKTTATGTDIDASMQGAVV